MRRLFLLACAACSSPGAKPDAMPPDAAHPSVEITPGAHDFGAYALGVGATAPSLLFTIKNVHGDQVDLSSIAINGTGMGAYTIKDNSCGASLADQATCALTIEFQPLSAVSAPATLDVTTGIDVVSASLSGAGNVDKLRVVFTPSVLEMGSLAIGETSETKTVIVSNEAADATFTTSIAPIVGDGFALVSTDCNAHIPLHGTCTAMVKLTTGHAGEFGASLVVAADGGSWSAGLRGTSEMPFVARPYSMPLGSMLIGQSELGDTAMFTVQATGSTATGTLTPSFIGDAASDYVVDSTDCTTLAPLATCSVVVRFAATARGVRKAELVVTDGTSSQTAHTSLTASGYTVLITTDPSFTATAVGQTTSKTFTIVNASDHDSGPVSIGVTGGAGFAGGATNCDTGIPAHNFCTVSVDFSPTSTGAKSTPMQVTASPGGTHSVMLTGTGT